MCGTAGYWAYGAPNLRREDFAAFTHSLAHRGPDGFGIESLDAERLWLGHRRLSILDVSERGRQPMSYAGGRYWLTYNGEVFNYLELRQTLQAKGYAFRSDTDSEVILAAYAEWGPDCQTHFNGMWAMAIWDSEERTLFLSRDRFGIKPLHYSSREGSFSFASELKSYLALPGADGAFDEAILAETLVNINGQEGTPYTLLPHVNRLPGGHCLTVSADGEVRVRRWWDTLSSRPACAAAEAAQAEEFRSLFFDACRLRLRSDVPIATALSGGLDSSSVACTLAELGRRGSVDHVPADWQRAFVACFPGTRLDERQYAQQVVDHTGMKAVYQDMDDRVAVDNIEKVVFDLEAIYWVPLVGPWGIYRAMRDNGIRVSLDGHGADEMLGGYHFFIERALDGLLQGRFDLARYLDLKKVMTGLAGGSADITRAGFMGDLLWLARREVTRLGLLPQLRAARHLARRALNLAHGLSASLAHGGNAAPPPTAATPLFLPLSGARRLYDENKDTTTQEMSALDGMLYTWFHKSVLPTILRSYDRASMSHGIEVRMPFMDWRIVTYCFALPERSKVGDGYTKKVLRDAMAGLMPDSIRLRTNKIGFTTPLDEWMRGNLHDWAMDLANSRDFLESSIWDGAVARATLERALAGEGSTAAVWPIINAAVLQKAFKAKASAWNMERMQ